MLEIVRAGCIEITPFIAVRVEVRNAMLLKFFAMSFNPLRRAEQPWFLPVPCAIDNSALRIPTLPMQFAEHAGFFEHCDHSGNRIVCSVHPSVMMIATQYPLVR